jgi:hypothetical protein
VCLPVYLIIVIIILLGWTVGLINLKGKILKNMTYLLSLFSVLSLIDSLYYLYPFFLFYCSVTGWFVIDSIDQMYLTNISSLLTYILYVQPCKHDRKYYSTTCPISGIQNKLHPYYVTGLSDGESSFTISICKNNKLKLVDV